MQGAFKELKVMFKEYMKHLEEQNSKQTKVRQVQKYCELSFNTPVEYGKARRLRGNYDVSALIINTQRYIKQEWNAVFPIVSQLRFQILELNGISNIMTQIKNVRLVGLKQLTISYCYIQNIESLQFMNLNVLKQLNLSHNAITSLKSLRKINTPGLEQLNVSDNCLVSLQFIEQIKLSKHMKQIIIQYIKPYLEIIIMKYAQANPLTTSVKYRQTMSEQYVSSYSFQDLRYSPALMACFSAATKSKDSGLSVGEMIERILQ